ncbi:MAG: hypothetical protein ABI775_09170 [Pseudonocardiales bacterium]
MRAALRAGVVAAVLSGTPSTAWALATRADPLEPSLAAGSMLLPRATSRRQLLVAATGVHAALSLGWAQVLALVPGSRRRTPVSGALWGAGAGLIIAALDLGLAYVSHSARLTAARALPALPQAADHLAYGAIVGALLAAPTLTNRVETE